MDMLRATIRSKKPRAVEACLESIGKRCRDRSDRDFAEAWKTSYRDALDDENDDGKSFRETYPRSTCHSSKVVRPSKVLSVTYGTRPGGEILRERHPTAESWRKLEVEYGFEGDAPAAVIPKIFANEPDVRCELPSICHAVNVVAAEHQGDGPERIGMRCVFLPIAHAELNPIELLWSTLRSCRRSFVPSSSKVKGGPSPMEQHRCLIALMLATASPELVMAFYRHCRTIEGLYSDGMTGPEAMAALARIKSNRKTVSTSFNWRSHWCPPMISRLGWKLATDGTASSLMTMVREISHAVSGKAARSSEVFEQASLVLGADRDCRQWSSYDNVDISALDVFG